MPVWCYSHYSWYYPLPPLFRALARVPALWTSWSCVGGDSCKAFVSVGGRFGVRPQVSHSPRLMRQGGFRGPEHYHVRQGLEAQSARGFSGGLNRQPLSAVAAQDCLQHEEYQKSSI